ncbi:MAG: sigma factor-like helix-turn-helix DNA-binding protein [Ilumatobacteraceae bacterium]
MGRVERRPPRLPTIDPAGDADADAVAVRELLDHLPQAQREAIVLRYYLGLRDPEIAEAMNCPLGTAKSHVRRGLESMRRALR